MTDLKETERHDDEFDYDERECANCGGEGFTYGCSWDWQCDTYDEGEGTCLCTRTCEWCSRLPPGTSQDTPTSKASPHAG